MHFERPMQRRDEELIGVGSANEPGMRETERIDLGDGRTLDRRLLVGRDAHGALLVAWYRRV
jgi:hypothetical protein